MSETLRIAAIAGDGIGPEVMRPAVRVLEALSDRYEIVPLEAGYRTFQATGSALPPTTFETARECDAILFGAVGSPSEPTPGYRSPILELRRRLDLFANLRPIVSSPLPSSRRDIDLLIVRENTEGLYSGRERLEDGGDTAIAERVVTRRATERIVRCALDAANDRARSRDRPGRLTIVHKANVLRTSDALFREAALSIARSGPDLEVEEQLVDSAAYRLVREPERFDVIVAPNLYGDILSDLAAGLVGGLGLAASANLGDDMLLAEPVHGSAPDIAGQGIANPIATLRAVVLMLESLGELTSARRLAHAVDEVLETGPHTPDLGGSATTDQVTACLLDILQSQPIEDETSDPGMPG